MSRVVADTGPLHYLVLTGDVALLPRLFENVLTPQRVHDELARPKAPDAVRAWIAAPPPWLQVRLIDNERDAVDLIALDEGERDAIVLAAESKADLLLMDDRAGRTAARRRGFAVNGDAGPPRSRGAQWLRRSGRRFCASPGDELLLPSRSSERDSGAARDEETLIATAPLRRASGRMRP